MSLFRTKEWWRTECAGSGEVFDGQSLLVARGLLGPAEDLDVILVGSHAGFLRIYAPKNHWDEEAHAPGPYKSTDLVVEAKLADCILDLKVGKFISGSQDTRLAILTPTKLAVYIVTLIKGSTDHGDRCDLQVAYEHQVGRFPASLVVGGFGGARGRDFLCVQCLDGTLLFYEQEVFAFGRSLRGRLLPEPMVYVARNDVFVTLGAGWLLECYRYQSLAEAGRKEEGKEAAGNLEVSADWSYNIGEPIIGINAVVLSSFEVGIVVLGERSLYCLGDACTSVKSCKRLEYSALGFLAYVIEPDGKLMAIVIADTSTLMIYEGTSLKWSAQLPFAPVAVAKAHLQNLEGAIVILSEEGRLEVCYLGSEPSVFIAPPIHRRGIDYVAMEKELLELRRFAKKSPSSDGPMTNATMESELSINALVSPEFLPAPNTAEVKEPRQTSMCKVSVELSSYTGLRDVQVILEVPKPLVLSQDFLELPNLCEKYTLETTVHLEGSLPALSSELCVTASYANEAGHLRVVQRSVQLPLKLLLRPYPPESTAPFSVILKSAAPVLNFSQLFPEFVGEFSSRQTTNSLGLEHAQAGLVVTISSGLMLNRYRVQAASATAVPLVLHQLIGRLRDKSPSAAEKLTCALAQQHLQLLQTRLDVHFAARLRVKDALREIGLLTTQLRSVEKRMLRMMRERSARSLAAAGLPRLLESTYRALDAHLEELRLAREERENAGHELRGLLRLLLLLLQLAAEGDKCAMLEACLTFEAHHLRDEVDWEEVADVGLLGLMRALGRKPEESTRAAPAAWSRFETPRDLAKLKKRLVHALEKLSDVGATPGIKESPAEELVAEAPDA